MPPSCLSKPRTPRSPPALPEPSPRATQLMDEPCVHSPPSRALLLSSSPQTRRNRDLAGAPTSSDAATTVLKASHGVHRAPRRRLHRSAEGIDPGASVDDARFIRSPPAAEKLTAEFFTAVASPSKPATPSRSPCSGELFPQASSVPHPL